MEYKGYIIKNYSKSPNLKVIVTAGKGGKIPDMLGGAHLTAGDAMKQVDKYLAIKEKPRAKAKTTSKSS